MLDLATADLTGPVRSVLRSGAAAPTAWSSQELVGGFGNPISVGVHRVRGTARDGGTERAWSLVLKIVRDPARAGLDFMGSSPDHHNYWRREPLLFATRFFDQLPNVFSYPACHGVDDRADGDVWLWLEDVADPGRPWTAARFDDVAHRAGRFNGAFLVDTPLPSSPLLGSFTRSWVRSLIDGLVPYVTDPAEGRWFWSHPDVIRLFGPPADNPVRRIIRDLRRHVAALDRLPRTLCHRDLWAPNLLWPEPTRCVVIDWGMAGIGPVGEDVVQLSWSAANLGLRLDPLVPYLAGLRDAGWDGDETLVRYAHAASFAARVGPLVVTALHGMPGHLRPVRTARQAADVFAADAADGTARLADDVTSATALATQLLTDMT